ncbi:MAG: class I SAM-dependent methyltransferase [Candidatus Omnitrophica bacterium]|nr:class I SAM-dependent methyltransferase [Candidatus Omnitrophota bacterium]
MELLFTGERLVPDKFSRTHPLYVEHITRYMFAAPYVKGKKVLDAACGCGYGAEYLSKSASEIKGIDISQEAIGYCKEHYGEGSVEYYRMDCCGMDFPDGAFDVVVAFEFIEHIAEQASFLNEVARVLAKGGTFIVSTPNKTRYLEVDNPYHVSNMDVNEFEKVLGSNFGQVKIYGQKPTPMALIRKKLVFIQAELEDVKSKLDNLPLYLIKKLVPGKVKDTMKKAMNGDPSKNGTGGPLVLSDVYPMAAEEIEISDERLEESDYLVGVCRK